MKKLLVALGLVGALLGAGAAVGYWRLVAYVETPLSLPAPLVLSVGKGSTLRTALSDLAEKGALEHPSWAYAYARLSDQTQVRAGEYLVETGDTPRLVLKKLAAGQVRTEQFALIEGHNRWQVRDALVAQKWMTAKDFDRLCDDPKFLEKHRVPGPSCEGYLFPDTYTMARGLSPEAILGTMFAMFHKVYAEVSQKGTGPLGFDMRQLVTLAAIVEKETGATIERPRIACVFYNRLLENQKAGRSVWRLETDPTVIYAATLADPKFDGNIKRSHLRELKHPYNTYHVFGLPPGPIANPGRAAMAAVVEPAKCGDFFFVSMNNGQHVFCPTLDCHNKAVEEWQIRYFRRGGKKIN